MATFNIVPEPIASQDNFLTIAPIPPSNEIVGSNNPDILFGTPGDDFISALDGDDTIIGTTGNDTIVGGNGFDTVDYSTFNEAVTILPAGDFDNGSQTQLTSIEKIIAPRGLQNTIDASSSFSLSRTSIDVDLSENSLVVTIVSPIIDPPFPPFPIEPISPELTTSEPIPISPPFLPPFLTLKFQVENFVDVTGTDGSDRIVGNSLNNRLKGGAGSDDIIGKGGNDFLNGGAGSDRLNGTDAQARGAGERDALVGGNDGDVFILGDEDGSFYRLQGDRDFARIRDFSFGDRIELSTEELYTVERFDTGFNLFVDSADTKELVARVRYSFGAASAVTSRKSSEIIVDSNPLDNQIELPSDSFQLDSGTDLDIFTVA